ncbi:MAG TPA: hypothetical protein VHD90_14175 [Phototrophicaceae bacterium]|nr:hypothetical protein [Phototrophicaceae bacterium]
MKQRLILIGLLTIALCMLAVLPASAQKADETRTVGAYDITIGWRVEPAYVGVFNGPEFWIKTHADGKPVTGAEQTLHLLVHFGDQAKLVQFYPLDDGHYTADLIPTRPGDYTFHLFGTINNQSVDEQFTSADGDFASVDPQTDILFPSLNGDEGATPEATPEAAQTIASLQAQIDDLRQQLQQLQAGKSS